MEHSSYTHASNVSATGDQLAVVEALRTQDTFDRAQVAWLMSQAMRWGYENRVSEENGAYPPEPILVLGKWYDQAIDRQKADARLQLPRPDDFTGRETEPPPLRVAA